nr:MAG TPA: hypothetical protein [Caudoviricetes sp.]
MQRGCTFLSARLSRARAEFRKLRALQFSGMNCYLFIRGLIC